MSQAVERGSTDAWTIQRLLAWASDDFKSRGFDSARLEAELLLAHALDCDRVGLIVDAKRALLPAELARFRELIKRRRSGEPVAYLRGTREFYGLEFRVDARSLIPRPDTETLVEVALARTAEIDMFGRALDLCTGSGAVAIAFAKRRPTWRVTGVDISSAAVALAWENAIRLGAVFGTRFVTGDLTEPLAAEERFELVTANPPYIPTAVWEKLDPSVRDFEPRLALDGGPDGLAVTRRIFEQAVPRLVPGGVLALEVHFDQAASVSELCERAGLVEIDRRRDYGGIERVVSARRPNS